MNRQLALRVGLSDLASFDNFHAGSNSEAVAAVRDLAAGRAGILYLHGGPGTGKSHLLYAAVKEAGRRGRSAIYASRAAVESQDGDWLDLPGSGLVCIDDIAEVLGEPEARALFALYERIRSHSGSLVLSARHSPESGTGYCRTCAAGSAAIWFTGSRRSPIGTWNKRFACGRGTGASSWGMTWCDTCLAAMSEARPRCSGCWTGSTRNPWPVNGA